MREVETTIMGLTVINERPAPHPEWVSNAMVWFGLFSSIVSVRGMSVRISADDEGELEQGVIEIDEWITIEPWECETPTIAGIRTAPGFALHRVNVSPGSYWEPPSSDIDWVDDARNIADAVQKALLLHVSNHMDGVAESYSESKFAAEMADLCM